MSFHLRSTILSCQKTKVFVIQQHHAILVIAYNPKVACQQVSLILVGQNPDLLVFMFLVFTFIIRLQKFTKISRVFSIQAKTIRLILNLNPSVSFLYILILCVDFSTFPKVVDTVRW
ncbi:unnamed protein product [Gongylonema pulchrum]|uniref:G_PROTEIN_RECEP_F1_2 domain-containing protein n=1 Tax=Gongylonema pulchrum TaxID=637853 RepID=A0A183DCU4_9BILA|nr:unnamed protein product [Gongylonema pulchrum]